MPTVHFPHSSSVWYCLNKYPFIHSPRLLEKVMVAVKDRAAAAAGNAGTISRKMLVMW
jgi:hypothetical protein